MLLGKDEGKECSRGHCEPLLAWVDGAGWAAMLCTAGSGISTQSHTSGLGMGVEVPEDLYMGPLWAIIEQEAGTAAGCAVPYGIHSCAGKWDGR